MAQNKRKVLRVWTADKLPRPYERCASGVDASSTKCSRYAYACKHCTKQRSCVVPCPFPRHQATVCWLAENSHRWLPWQTQAVTCRKDMARGASGFSGRGRWWIVACSLLACCSAATNPSHCLHILLKNGAALFLPLFCLTR